MKTCEYLIRETALDSNLFIFLMALMTPPGNGSVGLLLGDVAPVIHHSVNTSPVTKYITAPIQAAAAVSKQQELLNCHLLPLAIFPTITSTMPPRQSDAQRKIEI